jgi:hypothetical protein
MATFGTFAVGQVLTAAELNATGAYTSFTPSWTNLTVGNGTVSAAYSVFNKILFCTVSFTLGSTSAVGDPVRMTIPGSLSIDTASQNFMGQALFEDVGTASYVGVVGVLNSTTVALYVQNASATYTTINTLTGTRPFASFSGDKFVFSFIARLA